MKMKWMVLSLLLAPLSAQAGEEMHCHHKMGDAYAVDGYREIMEAMHREMDITYTGDADTDFVRGMIPHHQAAVEMAKVELANGKDRKMRSLAKAIIFAQEQEIAYMTHWLETRGVEHKISDSKSTEEFKKAGAEMHHGMMVEASGDPDVDFARNMIPHHQGAVDMAAVVVRYGRTPEITKLAQHIVESQLAEIGLMKRWLENRPQKTERHSHDHD